MAAINITDLNNAKRDVEHIAEIATSASPTATDRFGQTKRTISGIVSTGRLGLSVDIHPSTAAGLAGTVNGQYFSTPSANAAESSILYLNDQGSAIEKKRYPSESIIPFVDFDYVNGNNSTMSGPGDWSAFGPDTLPGVAIEGGEMQITFSAGRSQAVHLPATVASLAPGEIFDLSISVRLVSGNASRFQFGTTFATVPSESLALFGTPGLTHATFSGQVSGADPAVGLYFGLSSADNLGCVIAIDKVHCVRRSVASAADYALMKAQQAALDETIYGVFGDAESNMDAPTLWSQDVGAPGMSYATAPGELAISFTAATNQDVWLQNVLMVGETYTVFVDATLVSGAVSQLTLGQFSSGLSKGLFRFTPTATKTRYSGTITAAAPYFSIGCIAADNKGCVVSIDNVKVYKGVAATLVDYVDQQIALTRSAGISAPQTSGMEAFLTSISRYDKPLTKIGIVGDSLMANALGDIIPVEFDEGLGRRPIRLDAYNGVPRRIYDYIAFNKAKHRRLDDAAWTKTGAWTTFNDASIFEPPYPTSLYHRSSVASAHAEITIPAGQENFALICHRDAGFGNLAVTLNGGSIAAYGPSAIALARARGDAADIGNPYFTVQYLGLPAGANTIRVSKEANASVVEVWGGFYWSGNTLMLYNVAHGGHSITEYYNQHMTAEVVENNFDAILYELPIMNDADNTRSVETLVNDLALAIDRIGVKDIAFMTPNPFGDNGAGTNYYPIYLAPSMEQVATAYCNYLFSRTLPHVNIFSMFKQKIVNRGGTLLGGEGGLWYTHDGQHPNEAGCREWFNLMRPHLSSKPFQY